MSTFQIIMLLISGFFAFKVYEHIQTLQDSDVKRAGEGNSHAKEDEDVSLALTPEGLVAQADSAYEYSEFERALELLKEADRLAPNSAEILFKLGFVSAKNGADSEAIEYYKASLAADEKSEFAHNAIASLYRKAKEYESARAHLESSLRIDPHNAVTLYNYGNLLVDMNQEEEAIVMYERALAIEPDFQEAKDEIEKIKKGDIAS